MVAVPHLGLLDYVRHVSSLDADGSFKSFVDLVPSILHADGTRAVDHTRRYGTLLRDPRQA